MRTAAVSSSAENLRLFGQPVVRQVATQQQHVRMLVDRRQQRLQQPCEVFFTCRSPTAARRVVCLLFSLSPRAPIGAICMPIDPGSRSNPAASASSRRRVHAQFYLRTMQALQTARMLPFSSAAATRSRHYTGIDRNTKDFDIFVRRDDYDRIMAALAAAGCRDRADLSSLARQSQLRARLCRCHLQLGQRHRRSSMTRGSSTPRAALSSACRCRLCPVEEMIWSKAFIMERERYDGADIMHLLLACAEALDWARLLSRFGDALARAARASVPVRLRLPFRARANSRTGS